MTPGTDVDRRPIVTDLRRAPARRLTPRLRCSPTVTARYAVIPR